MVFNFTLSRFPTTST